MLLVLVSLFIIYNSTNIPALEFRLQRNLFPFRTFHGKIVLHTAFTISSRRIAVLLRKAEEKIDGAKIKMLVFPYCVVCQIYEIVRWVNDAALSRISINLRYVTGSVILFHEFYCRRSRMILELQFWEKISESRIHWRADLTETSIQQFYWENSIVVEVNALVVFAPRSL